MFTSLIPFVGISLIWVFIYGLIFFFFFSLYAFAFFRDIHDAEKGLFCTRMYECGLTILHRGLILSTFEVCENMVLWEHGHL